MSVCLIWPSRCQLPLANPGSGIPASLSTLLVPHSLAKPMLPLAQGTHLTHLVGTTRLQGKQSPRLVACAKPRDLSWERCPQLPQLPWFPCLGRIRWGSSSVQQQSEEALPPGGHTLE